MIETASNMVPPHSIEAEQSVLGGVMLDHRAFDEIADTIRESDFYRSDHRLIWRHLAPLAEAGKPADIITVFDSLRTAGFAEDAGGLAYLNALATNTPSAANIRGYAAIVVERAKKRAIMVAADQMMAECHHGRSADEVAAECELAIMSAVDRTVGDPVRIDEAMSEACGFVDDRMSGKQGLLTGFSGLDELTAGLEPGQLVIVAARPSVGKTVFGANVADAVASASTSVVFFSLEMPRREIALRLMASRAGLSMHALRAGRITDREVEKADGVRQQAAGQRLWIDDRPGATVGYVRAKARRIKRKYGLGLIVIDYLGLMTGKGDNRTQELGAISRGLKGLAKELAVPIIALAQLNRGVEGRQDRRPVLSDLRDSGEIEQDCDIAIMLHREELHTQDAEWKGLGEAIVRKSRNGPLGTVLLEFDGERMRFTTTDRQRPAAPVAEFKRRGLT